MAEGKGDPKRLKRWFTRGAGRKKWVGSPHPWTALYRQLRKHMPDAMAKRVTSQWFHDVFGIWSGERKGKNPHGREVKKGFDPDQPRNPANGRWVRVQLANRDVNELLDPGYQFSHTYNVGRTERGVSVMESIEDLAFYFANPESAAINIRYGDWVIVELEGDEVPGARPVDAHLGERLVIPSRIIGSRPLDNEFLSMVDSIGAELQRMSDELTFGYED